MATSDLTVVPAKKAGDIATALEGRRYVVTHHPGMLRVFAPGSSPGKDEAIADLVDYGSPLDAGPDDGLGDQALLPAQGDSLAHVNDPHPTRSERNT